MTTCESELFERRKNYVRVEEIVGSCFNVHGRIKGYNGNPTLRIWIVGTNKLLSINFYGWNKYGKLPFLDLFLDHFILFQTDIFGDFTVCPLSRYKQGTMQRVCIDSGKNLVVEKHYAILTDEGEFKSEVYKIKETWKD